MNDDDDTALFNEIAQRICERLGIDGFVQQRRRPTGGRAQVQTEDGEWHAIPPDLDAELREAGY